MTISYLLPDQTLLTGMDCVFMILMHLTDLNAESEPDEVKVFGNN